MMKWLTVLAAVELLALAGCSAPSNTVPVSGTVTLDGTPLANAGVSFHPEGKTEGLGGHGSTGADGKYTILPSRGTKGLPPGDYTVVISRRLNRDGSLPDPNVPPIESTASETLPLHYSDRDQTKLKATVSKEKPTHDFALELKKKS